MNKMLRFSYRRFGFIERLEAREQAIYVGHLKKRPDPLAHSDNSESSIRPLARREDADDTAESGGVHIRHFRKIDNDRLRMILPGGFLKVKQGPEG